MPIYEDMKSRVILAMKEKNDVHKNIMRVVLAEIQAQENKYGKVQGDDEKIMNIIRKVVQSNNETLKALQKDDTRVSILTEENAVLAGFLPKTLSVDEIREVLAKEEFPDNEGKAIGVAIRVCKLQGLNVLNSDVATVVKEICAAKKQVS